MILKYFELNKIDFQIVRFILFHGRNDGLKNEEIKNLKSKLKREIINYDEKQILENKENFFNQILNKSLFEDERLIIINRASDKIETIIQEILEKNINEASIIINAELLDKKSKLRVKFEKSEKLGNFGKF